ncbi:MAG TPA: reverse transcriptase family protein, partial [Gemmataceae bacterium]
MATTETAPAWLLRPVPANVAEDDELNQRIDALAEKLPGSVMQIHYALHRVQSYREYDAAANRACVHVWRALDRFFEPAADPGLRTQLLTFAREHMPERAQARVLRRLIKDPVTKVREFARRLVERSNFREVALPATPDGAWDPAGWARGTEGKPLSRHKQGRRVRERLGLPDLTTLSQVRKLLGVKSPSQLGYLLLASDRENGPYTKFTIPKRDGRPRDIHAPKPQLRWVQRRILDEILAKVPAHDAAHGFVPGRSTVTNALPHRGAAVILKFDLTGFFPTVHYYRVLGLFASLGYAAAGAKFGTADRSRGVAPVLARLCCYTPDPRAWGNAVLPQGAPTSPAISNLVCRRLDARLDGLARRNGGVYTRYADDLTFSFKENGVNLGRFRWWVDQVCHQEGFFVNQGKFRVIRAAQRQVVTGIVVNDELRVPREERRRFRAVLHNCRTHGVESQARGRPKFAEYLRGFASYVHMVHPEEGA